MGGRAVPPASGTPEPPDRPAAAVTSGAVKATRAARAGGAADQPSAGRRSRPAGGLASPGERLPPSERLRQRADFLRCYRTGRRRQGALAILYLVPNTLGHPRIGITTSRKVGNAVVRHRLKRWVKEVYRRWPGRRELAAVDVVAHLKLEARDAVFAEMKRDLTGLLEGVAGRRERCGGRGRRDERGELDGAPR